MHKGDNEAVDDAEQLQRYKVFASEFDRVAKYNELGEQISKGDFAKILIDLGFVHAAKLKMQYHLEFCMSLPNVMLLWTILAKVSVKKNYKSTTVELKDTFRALVAVLCLQVPEMVSDTHNKRKAVKTSHSLLHRNCSGEGDELCFVSHDDLIKFSMKFVSLKDNYLKNRQIREANLAQLADGFEDIATE